MDRIIFTIETEFNCMTTIVYWIGRIVYLIALYYSRVFEEEGIYVSSFLYL